MSKLKILIAAAILLLGGIYSLGSNNVKADELLEKQSEIAQRIVRSISSKSEISRQLEEIKVENANNLDNIDLNQTLEQAVIKALENIEIEIAKDKLELQSINLQLIAIGAMGTIPYLGDGSYTWPVEGYYQIDQYYKKSHKGVDIATRGTNPPVYAVQTGIVVKAANDGDGFGNKVIVYQGDGIYVLYAHLNSIKVELGSFVEEGEILGIVGDTGNSDGDHLHLQMTISGDVENATVNPAGYLRQ